MAAPIKLEMPFVNCHNIEIESQKLQEKVFIHVKTQKPTLQIQEDFFFDDIELPLPVGMRERSIVDKLSGLIRTGLKTSISSIGSAISLFTMSSPDLSPR